MSPTIRRSATWCILLVGLGLGARVVAGAWPRENRLRIGLSRGVDVEHVTLQIADLEGETWRSVELRPSGRRPRELSYAVSLPPADYRIRLDHRVRPIGYVDKNHGGGWTTLGTQHQIRLDGGDYRFPPPEDEAK